MNEFGNLLGTLYAPVSKIVPVKGKTFTFSENSNYEWESLLDV